MFLAIGLLLASQGTPRPGATPQAGQAPVVPPETFEVKVFGTANPWLAGIGQGAVGGILNGSTFDQVPAQAPRLVPLTTVERRHIRFVQVRGEIRLREDRVVPGIGPAGNLDTAAVSKFEPLNGLSNIVAPAGALLGVFLDEGIPTRNYTSPGSLKFADEASREASVLSPKLRQVFYIGNGLDSAGGVRTFVAPPRAKRLYLGVMDTSLWRDNNGEFDMTVVSAPE